MALLVIGAGQVGPVDAASGRVGQVTAEASVIKQRGAPSSKPPKSTVLNAPNPYLSYLPHGSEPDYVGWRSKLTDEATTRRQYKKFAVALKLTVTMAVIPVSEAEPVGTMGLNDAQSTAEYVAGFGTGIGEDAEADIAGDLKLPSVPVEFLPMAEDDGDIIKASPTGIASGQAVFGIGTIGDSPFDDISITVVNLAAFAENDGDINLAGATNVMPAQEVVVDAEIGDGPHNGAGSGSGDFDFYAIEVTDGQQVQVSVSRQVGETTFDSILALYDSTGVLLDLNDDVNVDGESALDHTFIVNGGGSTTVYYAVGGFFGNADVVDDFLTDPFDSSTGPGVGSEGLYEFSAILPVVQSGDFDFYSLDVVQGDRITVEVDTSNHGGVLDPIVALFDSSGMILAFNDEDPDLNETGFDSFLGYVAPQTDTYYIAVGGFNGSFFPTGPLSFPSDAFNSATGPGAGSKGGYDVIVTLNDIDLDYYSFDLEAGDIIGANLMGAFASLQIFSEEEALLIGSDADVSASYPVSSPLPGGGVASAAYIVSAPGRYAAAIGFGEGAYTVELRVFRPPQEATATAQKIFVDFDGASVDTSKWGGTGPSVLSPLSSFLPAWGLTGTDEDAVIDAILANFNLNLSSDIKFNGSNPTFDIEILNSRDDADPFGAPDVSRIIIGGTMAQAGLATIGVSESIDIGNFDQSEDSLVMLDLLSAAAGDPNSLNDYPLGPGASIIDLIGVGIGNIAAHEAGHFFANFHTDNSNGMPDLMDTGGNMAGMLGLGDDGVFGTEDDVGVNFGLDAYDPFENFDGVENTRDFVAYGLTTGTAPAFTDIVGLPDINSNGFADVAVIVQAGSNHVHVRDGNTGALISDIDFGDDPVAAMAVLGDISGNAMPEIALLGTRPNGNVRVQVMDSETGALVNNIFYGTAYSAVDMAVLSDTNGNGADELAVVGADSLGGVRVQARDALTDLATSTTFYGSNAVPIDVVTIPDVSANAQPEVLLHSQVLSTEQTRAQMRDASSAAFLRNIFFGKIYMPVELAVIGDVSGDGVPDLAHLGRRDDNGGVRIQVKRSDNGATLSNAFAGAASLPIAVVGIGDANGNSYPDVAMLVEELDGTAKIIVRDGFDGAFIRNIFVSAVSNPIAMTLVEDLDASGNPELAVLGDNGAGIRKVQIKDSIAGTPITEIEYP